MEYFNMVNSTKENISRLLEYFKKGGEIHIK
jgi:hypothetical protein